MTEEMEYEKGYFINSARSNYSDYTKKKFQKLSRELIKLIPIKSDNSVLDFGCATGGLISELLKGGVSQVKGTDISYWAISYGKKVYALENHLDYYNLNLLNCSFDIILFLDVLEHVPSVAELKKLLSIIKSPAIVVRLPVSEKEGENYFLEVSRNDVTHVQCHTKKWWETFFSHYGYQRKRIFTGESIYDSKGVLARSYKKSGEK